MTQLVTRIDDALAIELDHLVAEGVFDTRSDAVRAGLRMVVDAQRRRRTADAIVRGYREQPQRDDEHSWSDDATTTMIADEPW